MESRRDETEPRKNLSGLGASRLTCGAVGARLLDELIDRLLVSVDKLALLLIEARLNLGSTRFVLFSSSISI
jgi:hypothetical protein